MEEIQQLFPHFVLVLRTLWKAIKKRPISWIIPLSTKTLASTSKVYQLFQRNWYLCSPSRIFAQLMSEKSSSFYQTKLLLILMRIRIVFLKKTSPVVVGPLTTFSTCPCTVTEFQRSGKKQLLAQYAMEAVRPDKIQLIIARPISLTSCVTRTMEKLVNNQMLAYLSENSLRYKHQSGFLPNHSTVTQLCYLAHQWQMDLEKGEQVHTVFLDLSNAYDRVSIPGLLFKLSNLGFSNTTLPWMSSFWMDRQQRVRVNGCLSTSKGPMSSIPQETVLGPVLFLVYINNLTCSISNDCSIFADDTSVYNTGSKPPSICSMLSKDLHYAADWAAEWGMLFNAEKSEHLAILTPWALHGLTPCHWR